MPADPDRLDHDQYDPGDVDTDESETGDDLVPPGFTPSDRDG